MRSYPVKENPTGLAVSEILRYKHTNKQTHILLLKYKDITQKIGLPPPLFFHPSPFSLPPNGGAQNDLILGGPNPPDQNDNPGYKPIKQLLCQILKFYSCFKLWKYPLDGKSEKNNAL